MNAKFALALILTLQVSMSFCEVPDLPQDLVDRYNGIKERLAGRAEKLVAYMVEWAESNAQAQSVKGQFEGVSGGSKALAVRQVAAAIRNEFEPLVEKVRHEVLSYYNDNLRKNFRPMVETTIDYASSILDYFLPIE